MLKLFPGQRVLPIWKSAARAVGAIMYVTMSVGLANMGAAWDGIKGSGSGNPIVVVVLFSAVGLVGLGGMMGVWGWLAERVVGSPKWTPVGTGQGLYEMWRVVRTAVLILAASVVWVVAHPLSQGGVIALAVIVAVAATVESVEAAVRRRVMSRDSGQSKSSGS